MVFVKKIFNKSDNDKLDGSWKNATETNRNSKHAMIIAIGKIHQLDK
jgi:hypothetical protein